MRDEVENVEANRSALTAMSVGIVRAALARSILCSGCWNGFRSDAL